MPVAHLMTTKDTRPAQRLSDIFQGFNYVCEMRSHRQRINWQLTPGTQHCQPALPPVRRAPTSGGACSPKEMEIGFHSCVHNVVHTGNWDPCAMQLFDFTISGVQWFLFAIAGKKSPTAGTVDTWLGFLRAYGLSTTIWFVVDEFGGEDPIQGSVYQNGSPETVCISVHKIPTLRKIVFAESNCVRVHLEVFLFSLLIPELDGILLAEHVRSVISPTEMMRAKPCSRGRVLYQLISKLRNSAWLLSHGNHLSTCDTLGHNCLMCRPLKRAYQKQRTCVLGNCVACCSFRRFQGIR